MSTTASTPSPAPLAGPIAPPALVLPAAPAASPIPTTPAAAAPAPAPAATAAPVSVFGSLTHPGSEADDEILNYALQIGLGADLGIAASPPAAETGAPAAQPVAAVPAAPVEPVQPPAPETPQARRDRLARELAEADLALAPEGAPPAAGVAQPAAITPPAPLPVTAANPLANLNTPEHLSLTENAARQLKEFAITHRNDGGEVPLALAQLVENAEAARVGRQPVQITVAPTIAPENMPAVELSAEKMLTEHLPKRREILQGHAHAAAILQRDSADYLNPATEEGKTFAAVAREFSGLFNHPAGPLILRDLATGILANRPKPAAPAPAAVPAPAPASPPVLTVLPPPTVKTADGQTVPLAPSPAIGGVTGGSPVSQSQIDAAMARLEAGTASDQDRITLSAAAV